MGLFIATVFSATSSQQTSNVMSAAFLNSILTADTAKLLIPWARGIDAAAIFPLISETQSWYSPF